MVINHLGGGHCRREWSKDNGVNKVKVGVWAPGVLSTLGHYSVDQVQFQFCTLLLNFMCKIGEHNMAFMEL